MKSRVMVHVDMDAFFAAVEQRDNPRLKGRPVVVGADPRGGRGRGVVSTCSYEARTFGIRSAMAISMAYRLCPRAVFLPADFARYQKVSHEIFDVLYDFTPDVEPVSIDEAFLDITGSFHLFGSPLATGRKMKERIKEKTRLTASVGIAPIKMAAKIASDLCKPDGLMEIRDEDLLEFLRPLEVGRLWGVGPKTGQHLNKMGIYLIGDLARVPVDTLSRELGETGVHLHQLAHGVDPRAVEIHSETKSVSHEHTFEEDVDVRDVVLETLVHLSEKVSFRLRCQKLKGKTVTLKIRLKGFQTFSRACTLSERTNFSDVIFGKSRDLFNEFYRKGMKIRLVGVRLSQFDDPYVQDSIFEDEKNKSRENVHAAVDQIKRKFGEGSIVHAAGLAAGDGPKMKREGL